VNDWFKRIAVLAAGVTAIAGGLGVAWATADYLRVRPVIVREFDELSEQVAAVTRSVELQRWQFLMAKLRANGRLDPAEQWEFCALGRRLGFQTPGCA